ncbi:hypothetical protein FBU59_001983 [Linderina macrospora]|uniref:Uncharacterized protein n=1 Tax=Linderina macrospora TaxID=4868 RepID=A0ACC1JCP8_9FUNG|nr:hypothetical protein FBU59_001983 [Linderina macrospora]
MVRIAPQRVSVADPDIIKHVLGSHTYRKTPSYDMPEGIEANAFSTRSPEISTQRRRQIGPAFSHRNLADMQDKIFAATVLSLQEKLDAKLAEAADGKGYAMVNIYSWFSLIALDTIGILAFGHHFHALKNDAHELVPLLNRMRVLNYIASENLVQLLAGVDTTSSGLTWTLLLLLHNPHILRRVVSEVRSEFPPGHVISFSDCRQQLPYLAAVITESLRIMPPAPGILPRLAPADGVRLGGCFLPAGTWICCAIGALHMNPSVFPQPSVFDPERFLGEKKSPNMLAFSTGVRACIGKNLALVELHVVLSNLLLRYDVRMAKSESGKEWQDAESDVLAGKVPDIPRKTHMTMNPTQPERDCLVVLSHAQS